MTPVQAVQAFFAQHPVKRLGVAVSGGGDSVALLRAVLAADLQIDLHVAIVNHGLRAEAKDEALFVKQLADQHDLPFDQLDWNGPAATGNLMAQARAARRALLGQWARSQSLDAVALGHTQDDVAETFLMRLQRQSGLDGLAAMAGVSQADGMVWMRPLLPVGRAALRDYLSDIGQIWCDDPTNQNEDFDRARMRKALKSLQLAGLTPAHIATSATYLAEAREAMSEALHHFSTRHVRQEFGGLVVTQAAFTTLPSDQQRRLLACAIQWIARADYGPRGTGVEGAIKAIAKGRAITLGGVQIWHKGSDICMGREFAAVAGCTTNLTATWDDRWCVQGPDLPDGATIGALGDKGLKQLPDWRDLQVDRRFLLATPAIWQHEQVICSPLIEKAPKWQAILAEKARDFTTSLLSR